MRLFCFGILVVLAASCGPTTKIDITGTRDAITITTNQAVNDSSSLKIEINPNFDFRKHLKEVDE